MRDIPVPYELQCDCGHRVHGIRRSVAIQAECSACGSSVFVLPVNVYPTTRRVHSEILSGSTASRIGTVIREAVQPEAGPVDHQHPATDRPRRSDPESDREASGRADGDSTTPRKRGPEERTRRSADARPAVKAAEVPPPLPEPVPDGVVLVPRVATTVRVRRLVTPFRLLALASLVVIAGTGWWITHQRQLDRARKTWRLEMDAAETALKDGDAVALQSALNNAVAAATTLGRSDAESRRAETLLRQTQAIEQLSRFDLVEQLQRAKPRPGIPASSPLAVERVASLEGQWFVFDCPLTSLTASETAVSADLLLIVDGVPVRLECQSELLHQFARMHRNLSVIFAAQVVQCERTGGDQPEWHVVLDGTSACLITTEQHARWIGYDPGSVPELSAILERQSAFVEGVDPPAASGGQASARRGIDVRLIADFEMHASLQTEDWR